MSTQPHSRSHQPDSSPAVTTREAPELGSSPPSLPEGVRAPEHRPRLEELGEQLDSAMDRVDEALHALTDWWWRG
jgi:hypothetical protein